MRRVFLEDRGRIRRGEERDYPLGTWTMFFPDFEKITAPSGVLANEGLAKRAANGHAAHGTAHAAPEARPKSSKRG